MLTTVLAICAVVVGVLALASVTLGPLTPLHLCALGVVLLALAVLL